MMYGSSNMPQAGRMVAKRLCRRASLRETRLVRRLLNPPGSNHGRATGAKPIPARVARRQPGLFNHMADSLRLKTPRMDHPPSLSRQAQTRATTITTSTRVRQPREIRPVIALGTSRIPPPKLPTRIHTLHLTTTTPALPHHPASRHPRRRTSQHPTLRARRQHRARRNGEPQAQPRKQEIPGPTMPPNQPLVATPLTCPPPPHSLRRCKGSAYGLSPRRKPGARRTCTANSPNKPSSSHGSKTSHSRSSSSRNNTPTPPAAAAVAAAAATRIGTQSGRTTRHHPGTIRPAAAVTTPTRRRHGDCTWPRRRPAAAPVDEFVEPHVQQHGGRRPGAV